MGIDLRWEDENGKQIEEIGDPHMCISHLVQNTDLAETTCLRFIDPYGNTTFNRLQMPILIQELKSVKQKIQDENIRNHLRQVTALAEKSRDEIHTYLKFYGD